MDRNRKNVIISAYKARLRRLSQDVEQDTVQNYGLEEMRMV